MRFNTPLPVRELKTIAKRDNVDLAWERGVVVTDARTVIVDDEKFGIWDADTMTYLGQCIVWG